MKPYFDYPIDLDDIGIISYQKGMMLYDIHHQEANLLLRFTELFSLPYSVYLLDADGATLKINTIGASICGFNTANQAVGKTIFDVSKGNTAKDLLDNCASVLKQESVKIFDEFNMRHDGRLLQFLSVKFPCYDCNYQLQGLLGISIVLGEHSLADAITKLTGLELLPQHTNPQNQTITLNLKNIILTPREQECLDYTIKGFTAKDIAKKLAISPRTVEDYINQLKLKLGVCTKQQLIQKVLNP
jgi:DNA-binding CsgD family transcriptional regulator